MVQDRQVYILSLVGNMINMSHKTIKFNKKGSWIVVEVATWIIIGILICIILLIFISKWNYESKVESYCESQGAAYVYPEKCMKIDGNKDLGVMYGVAKIDDKFYLYRSGE